jgi:hypothetical protein
MAPVDIRVSIHVSWWVRPIVELVAGLERLGVRLNRKKAVNLIAKHGVKISVT